MQFLHVKSAERSETMPVPNTFENAQRCLCGGCPTYDTCMMSADELMYCARGASSCKVAQEGCICFDCPVHAEYKLDTMYYCVEGAAS
jgi:hypothetical protein